MRCPKCNCSFNVPEGEEFDHYCPNCGFNPYNEPLIIDEDGDIEHG